MIGSLLVKNSPDFETKNQYNLMVQAADNGAPSKVANAQVTVDIEDVNDHAPQFNQSQYSFTVSEGATIHANIGSVLATDLDSGPRGRLLYSIKGGDGNGVFTINGNSGMYCGPHTGECKKRRRLRQRMSRSNHMIG